MAKYIDIKDIVECQEEFHYWADELAKSVVENDPKIFVNFHHMVDEAFHSYVAALKKKRKQKKGAYGFIALFDLDSDWKNEVCFLDTDYNKVVKECMAYGYEAIVAVNEKGYNTCKEKIEAKKPWENVFWDDAWEA